MNFKKSIGELMSQPMDRKEFLARVGAVVVTLVGITAVLRAFGLHSGIEHRTSGYGSSSYGGRRSDR